MTQRRDNAVAGLEERLTDTRESALLREALELSNRLVLKEYDAIRLTILSNGYDPAEFPEVIGNIDSSFYDLTPDEQRAMAEELVFGNDYQQTKKEISDRVDECVTDLVEENRIEQERSSSELRIHLTLQVMWVAMLLVIVLFIVLSSMELVIMPLERAAGNIRREEPIPETGSREMRFLVHAYNEAFDKNKNSQEQLAYKAAHDPLTGLNNRGVFEKVLEKNDRRRACLIIIDIDYFKQVNDTRGHEAGDLVLKRVSRVITQNFREEDYICRIGGDEFAVVMVHAGSELTELVRAKIRAVQEELSVPIEETPAVTLSVGVAFSDHVNGDSSLYKDADKALYYVKEKGRNGLAFFDEIKGQDHE